MDIWKPRVRSQTRYVDQGYEDVFTHKRVWWNWLWVVPFEFKEKKKRPDKQEDYYTVSLEELVTQFNKLLETKVNSIKQEISKYLDEEFQQQVEVYIEKLDTYLSKYRDSLKQAQADKKLLQGEKEKLVEDLNSLVPDATSQIKQAHTYLERIDKLIPDK